jgi:outer membrane immunogenic protein
MKRFVAGMIAFAFLGAAGPLSAADLPVKAPRMVVDPPFSWTGWYVGGNAGYSWGRSQTDTTYIANTTQFFSNSFDMDGWLGGLQIGRNWQNANWVWGFEADIQATGQKGSMAYACGPLLCTNTTAVAGPLTTVIGTMNQKLDWFGTVRARGGITPTATTWAYVTGGLAYGHVKSDGIVNTFTGAGTLSVPFSNATTKIGWTVGAGVEGHLSGNWTAKLEYLYVDLGHVDFTTSIPAAAPPTTINTSSKITDNILRAGLNYKFTNN